MFIATIIISCNKTDTMNTQEALTYPETRKDTVVDTYFGEKINDFYR